MRVKKFGGKRKGYKGTKWDAVKGHMGRHWGKYSWLPMLYQGAKWSWGGKAGGRVTKPKGVGKATRGYGKAMRKK
jgi:hypothetical protein